MTLLPKHKWLLPILALLTLPLAQVLYFIHIYRHSSAIPDRLDLILIYSGNDDRTGKSLGWAKPKGGPAFLCSGMDFSRRALERSLGVESTRILLEPRAQTTDQNARFCAPMVHQSGARRLALALPWYHLPRALFLTRHYLAAGVTVIPYASTPLPEHWWKSPQFRLELVKFWGSLGRIALARLGIEHWPPPQWISSVP